MSTTVDERVVEMRFDNRDFEKNTQTTMSTLEKLKHSLKLDGAGKSLDSIGKAAKNVDLSEIGRNVEDIKNKFNALDVIGRAALTNLTNSAMNFGKNLVSQFTVEPIRTGFQEYETQIGAVQTILANTSGAGTTLTEVNRALKELNDYADYTIYNFTEMTRNIGTFTAAGVDLDTSVSAIQGIANVAAVSGSTSQQASTAMYQLSQALAAGSVKLQDWNSVVNAGMGGKVFQDALRETSELLGTGAEEAIKASGSFRESLSQGWITSEVLTETLKKFTTSGAIEYVSKMTGVSQTMIDDMIKVEKEQYKTSYAIDHVSEALAKQSGVEKDNIKAILLQAETATDAATKVKTFTQLMDTLREAAQSGWTTTWELIIGDFDEAKELFSSISRTVGDWIGKMSDHRNDLLRPALQSNWKKITTTLQEAKITTEDLDASITKVLTDADIDPNAILADYGSFQKAFQKGALSADLLKTAIQNVSGAVGDLKDVESGLQLGSKGEDVTKIQQKLTDLGFELTKFGVDGKYGKETKAAVEAFQKANDLDITGIVDDATLAKMKEMGAETGELSSKIDELMGYADDITELGGRAYALEGVKNILKAIGTVIQPIIEAFQEATQINPESIAKALESFRDFTATLGLSAEQSKNIKTVFTGLFKVLRLVAEVFGKTLAVGAKIGVKALDLVFKVVSDLLGIFGIFKEAFDFVFNGTQLSFKALNSSFLTPMIDFLTAIKDKISGLAELGGIFEALSKTLLTGSADLGNYLIEGLKKGVNDAIGLLPESMQEIARTILTTLADFLGIHSPSEKTAEMGEWLIEGFVVGIGRLVGKLSSFLKTFGGSILSGIGSGLTKASSNVSGFVRSLDILGSLKDISSWIGGAVSEISKALSELGSKVFGNVGSLFASKMGDSETGESIGAGIQNFVETIKKKIKDVKLGQVLAGIFTSSTLYSIVKFASAFENLTSPLGGVGEVLEGFGKVLTKSAKPIAKVIKQSAKVVKSFARVVKSFSKVLNEFAFSLKAKGLKDIAIGMAILLGVFAATSIALKHGDINKAIAALVAITIALGLLAVVIGVINKLTSNSGDSVGDGAKKFLEVNTNMAQIGLAMVGIAVTALLFARAMKKLGALSEHELIQGGGLIVAMLVLLGTFFAVYGSTVKGKSAANVAKIGKFISSMALTLLLMSGIFAIMKKVFTNSEGMDGTAIAAAVIGVGLFLAFVAVLVAIGAKFGQKISKIGKALQQISIAMLILVGVIALVCHFGKTEGALTAAVVTLVGFLAFVAVLAGLSKWAGTELANMASTMLGIAAALVGMAIVMKVASGLTPDGFKQALRAVIVFSLLVAGLIYVSSLVKDSSTKITKTLLSIAATITIFALIATALSFMDPGSLVKGIIAVGFLSAFLAVLIYVTKDAHDVYKTVKWIGITLGILSAALLVLSFIKWTKLAVSTLALMSVMGMLALVLNQAGKMNKKSTASLKVMTVAIGILGVLLIAIAHLPIEKTITSAAAISVMMLAFAGSLFIISKAGTISKDALIAMGIMVLVIGVLTGIIYLLSKLNIESCLATVLSLSALLLALAISLNLVSGLGASGVAGAAALLVLSVGLIAIAVALKKMQDVPFDSLVKGIGAFTIILAALVLSSAGMQLFATGAFVLIAVLAGIAVSSLLVAAAFYVFAKALGIIGKALPSVATGVTMLGIGIGNFIGSIAAHSGEIKDFAGTIITLGGSMLAALTLLSIGMIIATAGAVALGVGGVVLGAGMLIAGAGIAVLGLGIAALGWGIETLCEGVVNGVTIVINAIGAAGEAAIAGGEFIVSGFVTGIQNGLGFIWDAVSGLAGGIVSTVCGILEIESPSKVFWKIANFCIQGLKNGFSDNQDSAFSAAGEIGDGVKSAVENSDLIKSGKEEAEKFVSEMTSSLTKGVDTSGFEDSMGNVDWNTIKSKYFKGGTDAGGGYLDALGDKIDPSKITELVGDGFDMSQIEAIASEYGVDTGSLLNLGIGTGVTDTSGEVSSATGESVSAAAQEASSYSGAFKVGGRLMVLKFAEGMREKTSSAASAGQSVSRSAAKAFDSYYATAYTSGKHLGEGFRLGIQSKVSAVVSQAESLARKATEGIKKGQKEGSPSKITIQSGKYFGEGYIIGINKMSDKVADSAYNLGHTAVKSMSSVVSRIADSINSDVDMSPTIRPVVDLSEVNSSAGIISNTLGINPSIGILSNVGSINAMMNNRHNGTNNDIVSAIDTLSNKIDRMPVNSYNINGITYDDGSNISGAVGDLIRAARIERRI